MFKMNSVRSFLLMTGLAVMSVSPAQAANSPAKAGTMGIPKTYQITGEVDHLSHDTVSIRHGNEEVEFARPTHLDDLKIGDRITVFYNLDAKAIKPATQAAGQAGGVNDGFLPGMGPDGKDLPKGQIILDDRSFLNAKNQVSPNSAAPETNPKYN
jgi:hypothetical protein